MTASKRQKVIDTALDLVTKLSYGAVGVDDICAAADVKQGQSLPFLPVRDGSRHCVAASGGARIDKASAASRD